jgi:hypothetical protein
MNRRANLLFAACLATMAAGAGSEVIAAAEGAVETQDLLNVRAAGQVTASWTRQPDFYTLQVVMETAKPRPPRASTPASQPESQPPPSNAVRDVSPDRSSFFIGNTIANLRGLDPSFGCRTLTLVDGRRAVGGQTPAPVARPAPLIQSYPPRIKYPRIEVWLLKAGGTQILPVAYSCVPVPAAGGAQSSPLSALRSGSDEVSYRYSVADSAQAVAAAIRIDNDFYIEKLQPLEFRPPGQ